MRKERISYFNECDIENCAEEATEFFGEELMLCPKHAKAVKDDMERKCPRLAQAKKLEYSRVTLCKKFLWSKSTLQRVADAMGIAEEKRGGQGRVSYWMDDKEYHILVAAMEAIRTVRKTQREEKKQRNGK